MLPVNRDRELDDDVTPLPPPTTLAPDRGFPTGVSPRIRALPALRVVTACTDAAELEAAYGRYCDRRSLFLFTADLRPLGEVALVTITLADGRPVLRGTCEVTERYERGEGPYARAGIRLRFDTADAPTRRRLERIGAAAVAVAEMTTVAVPAAAGGPRKTVRRWALDDAQADARRTRAMSLAELRDAVGPDLEVGAPIDDRLGCAIIEERELGAATAPAAAPRRARRDPVVRAFWCGAAAGAAVAGGLALLAAG